MFEHGDLRIQIFRDPMFQENGMLLHLAGKTACWLVDPGFPPQPELFLRAIRQHKLEPSAILLTHCHADHIAGVAPLRAEFLRVPIVAPRDEAVLLVDADENLSAPLGLPVTAPPADRILAPGETIDLGDSNWRVLDVAGHSPGGAGYYCEPFGVALVGDAVFAEGIGRTDFHNSDHARLIRNIRENILSLPADTMLYPGHGPRATVREVIAYNQTLRMELA